jgi:hypothetical protein
MELRIPGGMLSKTACSHRTAFKMSIAGQLTTLHIFQLATGHNQQGGLIRARQRRHALQLRKLNS